MCILVMNKVYTQVKYKANTFRGSIIKGQKPTMTIYLLCKCELSYFRNLGRSIKYFSLTSLHRILISEGRSLIQF